MARGQRWMSTSSSSQPLLSRLHLFTCELESCMRVAEVKAGRSDEVTALEHLGLRGGVRPRWALSWWMEPILGCFSTAGHLGGPLSLVQ